MTNDVRERRFGNSSPPRVPNLFPTVREFLGPSIQKDLGRSESFSYRVQGAFPSAVDTLLSCVFFSPLDLFRP